MDPVPKWILCQKWKAGEWKICHIIHKKSIRLSFSPHERKGELHLDGYSLLVHRILFIQSWESLTEKRNCYLLLPLIRKIPFVNCNGNYSKSDNLQTFNQKNLCPIIINRQIWWVQIFLGCHKIDFRQNITRTYKLQRKYWSLAKK